jgi:hypothetical protein
MDIINFLLSILKNPVCADWAVAIGTFLLAIVTVRIHFVDDSYTKIIKSSASISFKREAFNFLRNSFGSWKPDSPAPGNTQQTVAQNIDAFTRRLIVSGIYLDFSDKKRFKKYINFARQHADAWIRWPHNGNEVNQAQLKIIQELIIN